jgi:hypothetical protein
MNKDSLSYVEGRKLISKEGVWRFVDENGNLLPGKFKTAFNFCNGFAIVSFQDQEKFAFINKQGEVLAGRYVECRNFSEGLAPVKHDNGKWGYVNEQGKETRAIYDFAYGYEGGKAKVVLNKKEQFIDKSGKVLDYMMEEQDEMEL